MAIQRLLIPERVYGQPIPVAPDTNAEVAKINELVDAVNAGLATSNAIVGGDKFVRYTSSQTYGVPADALTLDRLDPNTILPGVEATVINPHPTPLTDAAASTYYRATIVPAGTAGAVLVPAFTGSPDTVPIVWVEVVSNDTFSPLLASELNLGKRAYAGLELRPLLIALVNGIGTGSSTVVTTPATAPGVTGPTVTGFLPDSAEVGASVTLTGTGFTKATAVLFNGTPASFQVVNSTTIVAVVPAGATTGLVAVTNSAGTGTSAASFTVKASTTTPAPGDTLAPNITLTVPTSGATLTLGQPVQLTATATDNVSVTGVVFTNGATGAVLGTGTKNGNTYSVAYTPTTASPLTITATASDAAGNSQAASVTVSVQAATNQPPSVTINGSSSATVGTSQNYQSVASDSDGVVALVELLLMADISTLTSYSVIGSDDSSPYVVGWTPASTGTAYLRMRATDDKGAQSFSSVLSVAVQAAAGAKGYQSTYTDTIPADA